MAEIFVRHILNYNKSVKFNITIRDFVDVSTEGDNIWTLEIGTVEPDLQGDDLVPERIHVIAPEDSNFDDIIEKGLEQLAAQIDWSPLVVDKEPPKLIYARPIGSDVPIESAVQIKVQDDLPSAGIDLSNITVTINNGVDDFDITNEVVVEGDPFEYTVTWNPQKIIFSTYD